MTTAIPAEILIVNLFLFIFDTDFVTGRWDKNFVIPKKGK
jgi:hypothetical protein